MAEKKKPDDLAAELVPDPTKLPDLVVLRGHLGKSTQAGYSRLYLNLSFNEYVEVADEDVVANRSSDNPLGFTVLWVKRDAKLLRATVCSAQEQAAFLRGGIAAGALRRSRMELPVARMRGFGDTDVTDPLYYSTCSGPECYPEGGPGCVSITHPQ
jgi:hypothetical protein